MVLFENSEDNKVAPPTNFHRISDIPEITKSSTTR